MKPLFLLLIVLVSISLGVNIGLHNWPTVPAYLVAVLACWRWGYYASRYEN